MKNISNKKVKVVQMKQIMKKIVRKPTKLPKLFNYDVNFDNLNLHNL